MAGLHGYTHCHPLLGAIAVWGVLILWRCGSAAAAVPQPCHAPWLQKSALEAPQQRLMDANMQSGLPQGQEAGARLSLLRLQRLLHVPKLGIRLAEAGGGDATKHQQGSSSSSSSSSSSGGGSSSGTPSASRRHRRQLLHLDSADAMDAAEAAEGSTMAMMYPREPSAVERYLRDALRSGEAPFEVPVWFVVVSHPRSPAAANLTQQQVVQQVHLLNRAYASGLPAAATDAGRVLWRFKLMGVRYVDSKTGPMCIGSAADDRIKREMHPQLVQATANAGFRAADRTLIIYISDLTSGACKGSVPGYKALFGWSNTPMELLAWKQRQEGYKDGVVLDWRYLFSEERLQLEAGSRPLHGASTGAQLVHEVGHFMGLLHTFVGGCSSSAGLTDAVDDTPAEANPRMWRGVDLGDASGGCAPRDTCPGLPGQDPWDNYMTYNNLACAQRFTPGQQARMLYAFNMLRSATK